MLIRLLSLFEYMLEDSGSAENKEILFFSHDKLSLASILRPLHQVTVWPQYGSMEASESLSCENNNISLFSALPESSTCIQTKIVT